MSAIQVIPCKANRGTYGYLSVSVDSETPYVCAECGQVIYSGRVYLMKSGGKGRVSQHTTFCPSCV